MLCFIELEVMILHLDRAGLIGLMLFTLGADFYDGDGDGIYNPVDINGNSLWDLDEDCPDILGDETLWCVFHDGVPAVQRRWNTTIRSGLKYAKQFLLIKMFLNYRILFS